MDSRIRELERAALAGDEEAEERLLQAQLRLGSRLARYVRGEHVAVWDELYGMGSSVRDPEVVDEAEAIARETMRRVLKNVGILEEGLKKIGYRFAFPEKVRTPPPPDSSERLEALERKWGGPLPLSLRAFYDVVGALCFKQDESQNVHDWFNEAPSDLERLGDDDPLWVDSLSDLEAQEPGDDGRIYFCFAPDMFHKANVSGGENHHVWLPDERADFRIVGLPRGANDLLEGEDLEAGLGEWDFPPSERFLTNLRESILVRGGFRGRPDYETGEEDEVRPILRDLIKDLVPF